MARPNVSDDLIRLTEELHEETTGSPASSFEVALRTVLSLAEQQVESWYPGKYAEKALGRVTKTLSNSQQREPPARTPSAEVPGRPQGIDPETQAVFKQVLDDELTLALPEAEQRVHGFTSGDVVQVIAYQVAQQDVNTASDTDSDSEE